MILFLHEDAAYRAWVTHHRQGFVLDGWHKPKFGHFVLHRAGCDELKPKSKHMHPTEGRRFKGCSLHRGELREWSVEQTGAEPKVCEHCRPLVDEPTHEPHVSQLARNILDYVLDVAIIHMEPDARPYHLTVADVAQCLHKTPGQLAAALRQLAGEGLISVAGATAVAGEISPKSVVRPTAAGLQQLPAFTGRPVEAIQAELAKLD